MKITIITVCYNAATVIEKTIKSIINQTYSDIEWVVVDGKSNDNTNEIIKKYENILNDRGIFVNFKSEKDKGIYDAMNKGIYRSTGEWCIFMNAGDSFYSENALEQLVINDINKFDIIYGDAIHIYKNKYELYSAKNENRLEFVNGMEFCHQSAIIRKDILQELLYSTNYDIAGDFEFFVRAFIHGIAFKHVNSIIAAFEMDGISSTNAAKVKFENNEIKFKYNLISKKEYKKNSIKFRIYLKLRMILPKSIVMKRHEAIMKKATKYWRNIEK